MDLLKEGGWSDVLWSLKRYYPQRYKFAVSRTCQQIKDDVLNSRRVQHAIQEVILVSFINLRRHVDLSFVSKRRGNYRIPTNL